MFNMDVVKYAPLRRKEKIKTYVLNPPYFPRFGRAMRWQDIGRAGTLYYPVWLSYATGVLEREYETRLVDAPAWGWDLDRVVEDIRQFKPGLIVMDSSFPSLNNDISVAETIKAACHDVCNLMVGPPTTQFQEKILSSAGVDIIARWEYDLTVKEVADALTGRLTLGQVAGISYKENGQIIHNPNRELMDTKQLDEIPFVSQVYKKHLNHEDYFLGDALHPHIQPFSARGCPFLCSFCVWPQTLMGRKYRPRSVANVMDEIEWIQANMPYIKDIYFEDDTFTVDKKRVLEFSREYLRRGLTIDWTCNTRGTLDRETLKAMKQANCRMIIIGYESANDEILKNIKKGTTVAQLRESTRYAQQAGILVHADFIIGLPGETRETIQTTWRFIQEIKPDLLQVSVASPFPGTEFYDWAKSNNYLLTDDPNEYLDEQGHQKSIISYPWLPAEEIVQTVDRILRRYYLSIRFVPVFMKQAFRRTGWHELKRVWATAKMFLKYIVKR